MSKNKFIISIVALLWLTGTVRIVVAQDSTVCRMAIQKVFKLLQNSEGLMKSGVFIDYKTRMCFGPENGLRCGEDSAQLIMKNKKSILLANQKRIYRDDSIQVVILDDQKQIIITAMRVLDKNKIPQLNFAGIQDSLLFTSSYSDCKFEMCGTDSCYSATLVLSKKIQKQVGIEKVHYTVNKTRGVMKKVELDYITGKQYKYALFELKKVDYHYGKEPFMGTALQAVLDSRGNLLNTYKLYQLTDLRNSRGNIPGMKDSYKTK